MADGSQIKFPRMSEQTPGQVPGDVIMTLKQKSHKTFKRGTRHSSTSIRAELYLSFIVKVIADCK